jgi:hypothetical protein
MLDFLSCYRSKLALIIAFSLGICAFGVAHGQAIGTFGHNLLPGKMLENTEGLLEVYPIQNGVILPQQIQNLTVRSSDPSIIQVTGVEENQNGIATDVKIKAVGSGTANIALIAPGFPTNEFPVTIYGNQDVPVAIDLKTTPSSFSVNGPADGYVAAELVNSDGYPVIANRDTVVNLSQNDNSLLDLKDDNLVIKKGDYFAIGEFKVEASGTATIFANSGTMPTASSTVTIDPDLTSPHLQLYLYPSKIGGYYSSHSYAIVQLQDDNGIPVKAAEDIHVSLRITGGPQPSGVSSSPVTPNVAGPDLIIKKGSYWGYSTLVTLAGIVDSSYSVSVAANNYVSSDPQELDLVNATTIAQTPVQFDPLPILATGQDELIGVLELIDPGGNPAITNNDLVINLDSTDKNSLFPQPLKIERGSSSELVFARTGFTAPSQIQLYDTTDNAKLSNPTMYGPDLGALNLFTDTLVPQLLPGMSFPILVYIVDANKNSTTYFPDNTPLSITNNDILDIGQNMISKGPNPILLNAKAIRAGTTQLVVTSGAFESDPNITILAPRETQLQLVSPPTILSNTANRFSLQLLDANGLPVPVEQDTKITVISNDKDVIDVPQSVTIKKGDSYALFYANPKGQGSAELTTIADGLPLLKSDLQVSTLSPTINLAAPDSVNATQMVDATLNVQYNSMPLSGLKVDWNVKGANALYEQSSTDSEGNAKIKLFPQDKKFITIHSVVSGGIFGTVSTDRIVSIGQPLANIVKNPINGANASRPNYGTLFFIAPVAGAISILILKKKGRLDLSLKMKRREEAQGIQMKPSKKAWLPSSILSNLDEILPKAFNKEKGKRH